MPGPAAIAELRPAGAASGCVAGWICDWTSATGRNGEIGYLDTNKVKTLRFNSGNWGLNRD